MMKLILAPVAMALAATGFASAATNGTAGPTSTATVDMSLTVSNPAPFIQITGLQDFDFLLAPGEGETEQYSACVYVSEPGVTYSVSVSGTPLTDGPNQYIYTISGTDGSNANYEYSNETDPPRLKAQSGYFPSNTTDCSDNRFLTIQLAIAPGDTSQRTKGQAQATVTMTVKPD